MLGKEFYPTPEGLVEKMLSDIDFGLVETVLEPSAGKGDICDMLRRKSVKSWQKAEDSKLHIDAIELDEDLRHILKGKGYRIIANDFLAFHTLQHYDLIVMNPPFSNGDEHLLKALHIQKNGGAIICLLNAETLKNPCTNKKRELLERLNQYQAQVEYLKNEFTQAERKTNVEVALIKVWIPNQSCCDSVILEHLKKADQQREEEYSFEHTSLIDNDIVSAAVLEYNLAAESGVLLIREHERQREYIDLPTENRYEKELIKLEIENRTCSGNEAINQYLKGLRRIYWKNLFENQKIVGRMPSELQRSYSERVHELQNYEFTKYNIYQLLLDMTKNLNRAIEGTIIGLFDDLTRYHQDEYAKNKHYYNGWKTNKSYKIGKKVIIPLYVFDDWSNRFQPRFKACQRLLDIEKVFNYLDGGRTLEKDMAGVLDRAEEMGQTKKVECKYFFVTFYKKGTCHIEFKDQDLLKKFNLFAGSRKKWIPPGYGNKPYENMDEEEKLVVDSFEGREEYKKTCENKEFLFVNEGFIALGASV